MTHPTLPPTARAVHAYLRQHADDSGRIEVSRLHLARHLGRSENWIRQSLRHLEIVGLIEIEHNRHLGGKMLANTYHVRGEG
jgi:DNA-binding GntR family transcriptional regulator